MTATSKHLQCDDEYRKPDKLMTYNKVEKFNESHYKDQLESAMDDGTFY